MPGKLLTTLRNTIPTVGVTTGPEYATAVNDVLEGILDDLEPGVKSGELNINADVDCNTQNLLDVLALQLNDGAALSGLSNATKVYASGGELNFVDGAGNNVQITASGFLNASALLGFTGDYGDPGNTAAARYTDSGNLYEFLSETSPSDKHGAVATGELRVHETDVVSSNRVTLTAPGGLAGSYAWQFPASAAISGITSTGDLRISSAGVLTVNETDTYGSREYVVDAADAQIGDNLWAAMGVDSFFSGGGFSSTTAGGGELIFPLNVRVGERITEAQLNVDTNTGPASLTWAIMKRINGGAETVVNSAVDTATGEHTLTATETVVGGYKYYVTVDWPSNTGTLIIDGITYTVDKVA